MYLELVEVNSDLSAILAPLLLGGLAAGYLARPARVPAPAAPSPCSTGARTSSSSHLVPVAAGATAAGVATAIVIIGGAGIGGHHGEPLASAPPSPLHTRAAESALFDKGAGGAPNGSGKHGGESARKVGLPGPATTTAPPGARPSPSPSPTSGASTDDPAPDTPPTSSPDGTVAATTPPQAESPDQPSPTPSPTPKPPPSETASPGQDIALSADGSVLSKGIGRFRTHVTNLPTGSGPTSLRLDISFSDARVHLEAIPNDCSFEGTTGVSCNGGSGASWNGVFDADMGALVPGESVTITLTVSIPGVTDPDTSDNTRSITLTRTGASRLPGLH